LILILFFYTSNRLEFVDLHISILILFAIKLDLAQIQLCKFIVFSRGYTNGQTLFQMAEFHEYIQTSTSNIFASHVHYKVSHCLDAY